MKDEETVSTPQKKVTPSLLDAFDLLKSPKDDLKVTGGTKIIARLLESKNEKDLEYVLKRLIRSLGANVLEMRLGYFATLVRLIAKFQEIKAAQLLELVEKELHASGSSKSEIGDVALGQILVCGVLFRSGLILKSTEEEQTKIMQFFQTASNKKSYLNSVATIILLEFINELSEEQFVSIVWSNIKKDYKKEIKDHNLDSLYTLMVLSKKFPDKVKLRKLIGVQDILHEDNIPDICDKLMTGVDFNLVRHPIYKEMGTIIAKSPHLQLFWTKIDSQLVKHNRNRELATLNILNAILLNIEDNVQIIPELLSDNFFKLFIDWFKGLQTASKIRNRRDNEDDHKIMLKKQKDVLTSFITALKLPAVSSEIRVAMLKKLLFNPGEINFTELTGSSIVKSIIADLDIDSLKKMAKYFKKVLLNSSKKVVKENVERNWYNNERVKAAEFISFIVNHDALKDDIDFKISYMQLLMCIGFFKIGGGDENLAISSELAGSIKACFYRCFTSRFSYVDNLVDVLSSLCTFITDIMKKNKVREKLEKQFSNENMECWNMLTEVCQALEQNESKAKVDKVFLILLYQLGLFLFSEPTHVNIARSSITELKSCYEHYTKEKERKSKKKKEISVDEPEWIEVVVEVLLSILSIESSVLRAVVQCVFRLLWENLTPTAIGQIVSVLDPDSEANPLKPHTNSDDEDDVDETDQEDQDEEKEEENKESESDESDSDLEGDDDEMKIPDQLRLAVQKALGNAAAPEDDAESIDADMISEEEGKKIDEALADAFKQFKGKNKISKKDRKNKKALSDFRIRVLDLIDIYLEKDPAMDICLSMIIPLTTCLEFCMQDNQFKELENRLRKTIKNLTKIKKFNSTEDITIEVLGDILRSIIDKRDRSHFMYQALGDVITYFAVFIIHCSKIIDVNNAKSPKKQNRNTVIVNIFKEAVENYFHNRSCLLPIIFFHNILQTEWNGRNYLLTMIIKNVFNSNVRQFRRNEGLNLLIGFYQAINRSKPSSEQISNEINNIEKEFIDKFEEFKSKGETEVTANFLATLKKLINVIKSFHDNCKIPTNLDFKVLSHQLSLIKGTVKSKNNEVPKQNGTKSKKNKKKKRKLEQVNGDHIEPETKKSRDSSNSE